MKLARLLPKVLLIITLAGGGLLIAQKKSLLADSKLDQQLENFKGQVMGLSDSAAQQTQELSKKGQDVGQHVNNVLGEYIEPANQSSQENFSFTPDENKPVYEETFEYGRYLYCQQVIKDYELEH